ncbi:MAG TPA: glycosyltransferase family 2 protein [Bacteroidales bacterium]|jgi:GT2 family glycosyltransferase|nr:glycosyltransferase family 2 protein [Bacteroidales bacterium]
MQWIERCLESCFSHEVIVVDNASSDGTCSFIKERFPNVILLEQMENLGFGQANNIGIKYALKKGADFVFLLNQDAYLNDGALEELISTSLKYPDYGIVSPIHLDGPGSTIDRAFSGYLNYNANKDLLSDYILGRKIKVIYELPFINAAAWLLTRKCLEKVGGFDPLFFHYGEDLNFCQRVKYHNFKIGVVPHCFIQHDRDQRNTNRERYFKNRLLEEEVMSFKLRFSNILSKESSKEMDFFIENKRKSMFKKLIAGKLEKYYHLKKLVKQLKIVAPKVRYSYENNKKVRLKFE